jgi:alanyl-tRNA synthetase
MAKAEDQANRVVWEDRPVAIRFASAEEAASLDLRKEPTRTGPLRLIDVEAFDLSACGGTHVARSGAVGVVALRSWEKFRGGMRLQFVCGGRALREFRSLRDAVTNSQRFLSVAPAELPAAIERAQGDNKDLKKTIKDLQERLAQHEAAALVARAETLGAARVVIEALDGWDQTGLKWMAASAAAHGGVVAALVSTTDPALVVIARSPDVAVDASAVLKALMASFGGKGGGKPDLAQGGGLSATREALTAEIRRHLAQALQPAP